LLDKENNNEDRKNKKIIM